MRLPARGAGAGEVEEGVSARVMSQKTTAFAAARLCLVYSRLELSATQTGYDDALVVRE
jgi:hypothetical protein